MSTDPFSIMFSGQLTEREFFQIQKFLLWPILKKIVFAVVALLLAFALLVWHRISLHPASFAIQFGPILLFLILFIVFLRASIRKQWQKNNLIKAHISGSANENNIEWHCGDFSQTQYRWDMFQKYRQSDNLILIFQAPNQAIFFPRSFFANDTDWARFKELVATKVTAK